MASLFVFLLLSCAALSTNVSGVRIGLTRMHSSPDVTASEFVRGAMRRDMSRFGRSLADSTVDAPIQRSTGNYEYVMTLAIGTPPVAYPAIADTGSDLIWTQCAPCDGSQCVPQHLPLFDPSSSSTFSVLPCNSSLSFCAPGACPSPCTFNYTYGLGWTDVIQAVETFTFGSTPTGQVVVPGLAFGCSKASDGGGSWNGTAGFVGLGRGSLSLVSQLGAGKFSYCLTPFEDTSSTSTLFLGTSAVLNEAGVGSTPFVPSPSNSSHYYLNLTGISVGTTLLTIPPDAFAQTTDGNGGLIIDSGTTLTYLVDGVYQPVRAAVQSLVTLPLVNGTGLDLCFQLPSETSMPPSIPSMTFHFDGADMVLPPENYMWLVASDVWCLVMQGQTVAGVSILGNYMQQNMHILHDLQNEVLSFAPAKCSTL